MCEREFKVVCIAGHLWIREENEHSLNLECDNKVEKTTKKKEEKKLTVGLEPTTAGLEVQRAIQLRHASSEMVSSHR